MRDANEEHRVLAGFGRGLLHGATGMLLEHVINVLNAGDVAFANAIDAFVKPADRRPERNAGIANLPARFQFLERRPDRVVINLLHPDVVQLQADRSDRSSGA